MANVAVVYYSATGNVHRLAQAVAAGAEDAGADVPLRRVHELAPDEAIDSRPEWRAHVDASADIPEATNDDLDRADGLAFGTPTRFGTISAQLKQVLDTAGPLWFAGRLADETATGFTSAGTRHGGDEATILWLYQVMYHWGAMSSPPATPNPRSRRADRRRTAWPTLQPRALPARTSSPQPATSRPSRP